MKAYPQLQDAVANTVEKLRKERRLTKTALADFADLQECYVRSITKGRRNPTVTAIYSICEALGIPVGTFFHLVEEERRRLSGGRDAS